MGIEDVLRAAAQVIALRESKKQRAEEKEREETARARGSPKNRAARRAQGEQGEKCDDQQADRRAQVAAATSR